MPLPSTVQTTDTFNTWLDATNNTISHLGNTSAYVQVAQNATPSTSVGNTDLNGVATVTQLATTGNVVIGGSAGPRGNTAACTTPVLLVTTNSSSNTISMLAVNLSISVTNTVISGTDFTIAPNTVFNGATTTFSKNLSFTSSNTVMSGTKLAITANADIRGTSLLTTANAEFQGITTLGGPVLWNSLYIDAKSISGGGIVAPLSVASNATILRITTADNTNVIAGITQSNTSQYRHLTVFNVGANAVYFQHGNTSAGANGIYCPGNTNFMIPSQGATLLYYDANTSVQRWRVMSAPIGVDDLANTSTSGYVGYTGDQTFGGNKTFQNTVTFSANVTVTNASDKIGFAGSQSINSTAYTGTSNNATYFNGQLAAYYTNATNISAGTLAIARLDANVLLTTSTTGINASAISTGTVPLARLDANVILTTSTTGMNASALSTGTVPLARLDANVILTTSTTGMNASALSTGTVPTARLASGTANSTTYLAGDSTWVAAATVPIGTILMTAGSSADSGYLLCDGASVSKATYAALFARISTTYGTSNTTHFSLPNLVQRFPLGKASSGTGSTLGSTGGNIDHTHSTTISTSISGTTGSSGDLNHSHTFNETTGSPSATTSIALGTGGDGYNDVASSTHTHSVSGSTAGVSSSLAHTHSFSASGSGSGTSDAANPPYLVVNFQIKY